ncbi:geminivirus rep catalytic domain-containing protein [Hirsutella rhossiliensis]|uniref:Geminivirus rep catalytic domain-containing protein n=1 Tax=Hirsutella rhossiliensis TaxID=111463 RepID=A0A9P8N2Z6_9HYPO|nr:geminivirus rep catalytic domain-containing protein [Hirsutella rhossiliensis]KAH0966718.1 geminivirus rep catalytic domain-containing protein [Hirsutella rhossiliensis]
MEVDPPASDSGYESVERDAREIPGVTEKHQDFVFHANMAFVTYTRSRVEDPEEFHRYLRESLAPSLPRVNRRTGQAGTVQVYGCKELHEDGTPHYHVMLKFEPRVHWRNAREKFRVWIDVKDGREVDTTSINIHKKPENETPAYFLQCVQAYIAKGGDVFGEWIGPKTTTASEKDKYLEQTVETESREEAETLLKTHFKSWWWRQKNFDVARLGRPTCLVIVGRPRSGKTEWALSFGRPAHMTGEWNMDELMKPDITHVVLNDIKLRAFPYKRDLAGCQEYITATGKYREQRTIRMGIPVIWTCNEDNDVTKDKDIGATEPKVRAWRPRSTIFN